MNPFFGNAPVVARLEAKLAAGRLPHAMIFAGPAGIGKRTCALRLMAALNCARPGVLGCGACAACRKIEGGTHPDVVTVTVEADASQIKVEQIRRLRSMLELEPLEGAARAFLIDPAERMNPAAANALLKALEEPPPRTHFFLITTNAHELLATIRSRSQIYHFSPLSLEEVRRAGIENELVARWSQGSIGRALATDPDELGRSREAALDFLESSVGVREADLAALLGSAAELARSKEDYPERLRVLGVLVRDLLWIAEGLGAGIVNADIRERLETLAAGMTREHIVQIGECLRFIEASLKQYLNRQMLTDVLALTLNPSTSELLNDKPWEYR